MIFAILGAGLAGPIVTGLIGAKGQVADIATRYLRVIVGGSFTIFLLLHLTSLQRALGSAKTPVSLLVLGNVLNVVLALVFVFGDGPVPHGLDWSARLAHELGIPRMGMVGAAWATVIARAVVLVPNVLIVWRRFPDVLPASGAWPIEPARLRQIVHLGWPSSAQFVLRIAAVLFVSSLVARGFTTATDQTATTAMGLVFRPDTMALFVAMGWGNAAQTFVGQNLGAGQIARARQAGGWTAAFDVLTNVALAIALWTWGERLLRVFDEDAAPIAIALGYLRTVAPSYVGLGVGVVLGNAMTAAGAARTTLAVDAIVVFAVQVPVMLVALLVAHVELPGLFACVAATNVAFGVANALAYLSGRWVPRA